MSDTTAPSSNLTMAELAPISRADRPQIVGLEPPSEPFPLYIQGAVQKGFGRGSKELGIPTANLPDHSIASIASISLRGVYYGYARVLPQPSHGASQSGLDTPSTKLEDQDLKIHPMVMSVGWNPYYKNERLTAEVHVMHEYASDFYSHEILVVVLGYIRPELNYVSKEALIEDINTDKKVALNSLDRPSYQAFLKDLFFENAAPIASFPSSPVVLTERDIMTKPTGVPVSHPQIFWAGNILSFYYSPPIDPSSCRARQTKSSLAMSSKPQDPFFPTIGSVAADTDNIQESNVENAVDQEEEERAVQEIESLCMSCYKNGTTRLLLTSIPFFREVVVMSFRCEHCGENNTEIQSAGEIQERGSIYTAHIRSREDFDRQVVKSPTCSIHIPQFQLTIPSSRGQLTNVEGIIRDTARDLALDQPVRKITDPETYEKIEELVTKLNGVLEGGDEEEMGWDGKYKDGHEEGDELPGRDDVKRRKTGEQDFTSSGAVGEKPFMPFTITLDDPAGNSFIQFLGSPSDPKWTFRTYDRTREQDVSIGLAAPEEQADDQQMETVKEEGENGEEYVDKGAGKFQNEEVFSFPSDCHSCKNPLDTLMKKVNIPYFQDIIIMSTNCHSCGYKDNEVKSGGAVSAQGKRIILKVEDAEDLSRDLLKSETCGLEIPEIELVLQPGTLGGRFTTLEGILTQVYEELSTKVFASGGGGDSLKGGGAGGGEEIQMGGFEKFLQDLKGVMNASRPFTLILDDPLANSYLQNTYAPDADPNMSFEDYDRDFDQNEELGLNDMIVEGYEGEEEAKAASAAADALIAAKGAKPVGSK
ncbi:C4-type Zn-finger protein [Phaffia rhodozyma]|uniref:riboflavin kinase n=1 Tax=Phaffia rhodozyma TaxID=264483 RepID=A0A0F7SJA8_PHARH|nr:C4-type Zn-finger protein [Phaffia rhodozyma]